MSEPTTSQPEPTTPEPAVATDAAEATPGGLQRFRISAAIVIALAAALIVWLVVRDDGNSSSTTSSSAAAVSEEQLNALATSVGHPVFWLGPKEGTTYESTQSSNGTIFVRYLPAGVSVGAAEPYLTVATYPFPGAYEAIRTVTKKSGITKIELADGGIAETPTGSSTSVHAAYPGVDYQVEVFDPTPGTATALVTAGQLAAIGKLNSGAAASKPKPTKTSPAKLKALAASIGHPIYWAGAKKGYTYELAQTSNGQVLIRYLPPGTKIGTSDSYLTIGTYPYPGAFAAVQALSTGPNAVAIKLAGGGLAVIDKASPQNIHLAYPGSDYQIEIFDPSAAAARRVASSGQIKSIG